MCVVWNLMSDWWINDLKAECLEKFESNQWRTNCTCSLNYLEKKLTLITLDMNNQRMWYPHQHEAKHWYSSSDHKKFGYLFIILKFVLTSLWHKACISEHFPQVCISDSSYQTVQSIKTVITVVYITLLEVMGTRLLDVLFEFIEHFICIGTGFESEKNWYGWWLGIRCWYTDQYHIVCTHALNGQLGCQQGIDQ